MPRNGVLKTDEVFALPVWLFLEHWMGYFRGVCPL